MTRVVGCVVCAMAVTLAAHRAAGQDSTRVRLDKAEADYQADVKKFRDAVAGHFDKREAAARRDGDKKLVDQVAADRRVFDVSGELPKSAPTEITKQLTDARARMDAAYGAAVKDYTRSKEDEKAAAVDKEWQEFKKGGPADGGWKRDFPVGAYECRYTDSIAATTELKADGTFHRARGKVVSQGKIEYKDGQLILRAEFVEAWSADNGKILVRHWYPAAGYPKGPWVAVGFATPPKK